MKLSAFDTYDKYVAVRKFAPVKVVDVVAGGVWGPVRFKLETQSGEHGVVDLYLTVAGDDGSLRRSFDQSFAMEDPRKVYPTWSDQVWSAVEDRALLLGMTKEQVTASWGKPYSVNRSTTAEEQMEQWVYAPVGIRYVYFRNGVMTSLQN